MQFHIWAEMVAGGMYSSVDDPFNTSMFLRAGGGIPKNKEQDSSSVVQALSEVATVVTSALFSKSNGAGLGSPVTPKLGRTKS